MDDIGLKNCPFCGGRGETASRIVRKHDEYGKYIHSEIRYVVKCTTCNATTRLSVSREDAREMWNRRAV